MNVANYLGIPWLPHGNTQAGVDCVGLVDLIYRQEFGIDDPGLKPLIMGHQYGPKGIREASLHQDIYLHGFLEVAWPEGGDVITFMTYGVVGHIGIFVEKGKFLHIEKGDTSYVERYDSGKYANKLEGFFRHRTRMAHA